MIELYYGDIQSGKSDILRCLCLYNLFIQKRNCIMILRNSTDDYEQMKFGFKNFSQRFIDYLHQNNIYSETGIDTLYTGDVIQSNGDFKIPKKFYEKIESLRSVNICIANSSQFDKMNKVFKCYKETCPTCLTSQLHTMHRNYVVLIDEVDFLKYSDSDEYMEKLNVLMEDAKKIYETTATPLDELFQDTELKADRVYAITRPSDYKSVNDILFNVLKHDAKIAMTSSANQFELDPNIKEFYNSLSSIPIFDKDVYNIKDEDNHPVICLHKSSEHDEHHTILFNFLKNTYPDNYAIVIYNGYGVTVYHKSLETIPSIDLGERIVSKNINGNHIFKNSGIQRILQYFKDNGGSNIFSHIIIISGRLAGRAINFVSKDYKWHLTHQYYIPCISSSTKLCLATILQAMRLCGIYRDSIPINLYTIPVARDAIKKGYRLQQEILDRIKMGDNQEIVKELIKDMKFNKKKIPEKCKLARKTHDKLSIVSGDDGYMDHIQEYDDFIPNIVDFDYQFACDTNKLPRIMKYIADLVVDYLRTKHGWVSRVEIVEYLMENGNPSLIRNKDQVNGHLSKCFTDYEGNNNLFGKQDGREWYLRI